MLRSFSPITRHIADIFLRKLLYEYEYCMLMNSTSTRIGDSGEG